MRNNTELLKIIREHTSRLLTKSSYADGLCLVALRLHGENKLNLKETKHIIRYIKNNMPNNKKGYGWEPGLIEPRLDWLDEHIEFNFKQRLRAKVKTRFNWSN